MPSGPPPPLVERLETMRQLGLEIKIFWFQAQVISRFNFSLMRADILAHVYVQNVLRKEMKEMKENKNVSTTI